LTRGGQIFSKVPYKVKEMFDGVKKLFIMLTVVHFCKEIVLTFYVENELAFSLTTAVL